MVQKAAVLGVPVLVAVSAPTALAVRIAEAAGITLVAVARSDGFEMFTHPQRIATRTARSCRRLKNDDKLVYMANQIGKFFASQGAEGAIARRSPSTSSKFWDPRMRTAIFAYLDCRRRRARSECPRSDRAPAQRTS